MKNIILFISLLFSFSAIFSQNNTISSFPNSYFGIYSGTLTITAEKGKKDIPMEFHLLPMDSIGKYYYTIVYGENEERQERKYFLNEKDREKGLYEIDENNGILLEAKLVGNKLYSLFEVNSNLLTSFLTFNKDHILFEIVFSNTTQKTTSGGTEEDIPKVFAYPITVVQKAVLLKK